MEFIYPLVRVVTGDGVGVGDFGTGGVVAGLAQAERISDTVMSRIAIIRAVLMSHLLFWHRF